MRPAGALKATPPLTAGELGRGVLLAAWVLGCDLFLKGLARLDGCRDVGALDRTHFAGVWQPPAGCRGIELADTAIVLVPGLRNGTIFGLFAGRLTGLPGQAWGSILVVAAVAVTVFVLRWRRRSAGDALALGAVWGGVLAHALPRLFAGGTSFTELEVFGLATGLGDLALGWGLVWLAWRIIAEAIA